MIGGIKKLKLLLGAIIALFFAFIFLIPNQAAAKGLIVTPLSSAVEVGKTLEVKIEIDTSGDPVDAVGFKIDYPTEILQLDFNKIEASNTSFPFMPIKSYTEYNAGRERSSGSFSGRGTVVILPFTVRNVGNPTIGLRGILVSNTEKARTLGANYASGELGYGANSVSVTTYASGQAPPPAPVDDSGSNSSPVPNNTTTPASNTAQQGNMPPLVTAPTSLLQPVAPPTTLTLPGIALGSIPQVIGPTGSTPEEILKRQLAEDPNAQGEVKGSFVKSPANISYITNLLMLLAVGFLVFKLFFTEKRRHLEMERLFEDQLGTLSALESKIDIFDQKGEGAKEKIIQEFEEAKTALAGKSENKT